MALQQKINTNGELIQTSNNKNQMCKENVLMFWTILINFNKIKTILKK